jgi:murein DD-endopeptidase MepM/ murein hydrolase activator NlpD
MAGIVDSINRIDALCATVGIRSPAGAGFEAALARALGENPAATAGASTVAPGGATAARAGPADVQTFQTATASGALTLPVAGPVTSPFGARTSPTTGAQEFHEGIDIAAAQGTPIRAAASGTVTFAGQMSGYGNVVIVSHDGGLQTRYAHQSAMSVTAGQTVAAGEVIGAVGATGEATGPHLHFEVRLNGVAVDPVPYLGLSA